MRYLFLMLLFAGCAKNSSFTDNQPQFRRGDKVQVLNGYYEGCCGVVRSVHSTSTRVKFTGECWREGSKLIDSDYLVVLTGG